MDKTTIGTLLIISGVLSFGVGMALCAADRLSGSAPAGPKANDAGPKANDKRIVKVDGVYHIEYYCDWPSWHPLGTSEFATIEEARERLEALNSRPSEPEVVQ